MCQILRGVHSKFDTKKLVNQLEKEYGVKVDLGKDMSLDDLESPTGEGMG
jgi:hypothetical protein